MRHAGVIGPPCKDDSRGRNWVGVFLPVSFRMQCPQVARISENQDDANKKVENQKRGVAHLSIIRNHPPQGVGSII